MGDDTQNGQSINTDLDLPGEDEGNSYFEEDRDLLREADLLMKDQSGFKIVNEEITVDLPGAQEPRTPPPSVVAAPDQPQRVEPEDSLPRPAPSQRQPRITPRVDPALQKEARHQIDQMIQQYQTDTAAIVSLSKKSSSSPQVPPVVQEAVSAPFAQTMKPEGSASVIHRIIADLHLSFESDLLRQRFLHIARSRLCNARTSGQTREALMRPKKVGGIEWSELLASSVTERLDLAAEPAGVKDSAVSTSSSLTDRYRQSIIKKIAEAEQQAHEVPASPTDHAPVLADATSASAASAQQAIMAQIQKLKEPAALTEDVALGSESQPSVPRIRRDHRDPARPILEDILPGAFSRPIGPVGELQTVTIVDFRRFSGTVSDRTQHLLEKFQLLEEDSWTRRAEGVNAWKRSPLNQLYVRIGMESMERAVPVERVIQERASSQKETLLMEEFNAIADLNKHLRY